MITLKLFHELRHKHLVQKKTYKIIVPLYCTLYFLEETQTLLPCIPAQVLCIEKFYNIIALPVNTRNIRYNEPHLKFVPTFLKYILPFIYFSYNSIPTKFKM